MMELTLVPFGKEQVKKFNQAAKRKSVAQEANNNDDDDGMGRLSRKATMMVVRKRMTSKTKPWDGAVFHCQHGKGECDSNKVQNCAIKVAGSSGNAFGFILCMELKFGWMESAKACAKQNALDFSLIHKCFQGEQGNEVEWKAAVTSAAIQPDFPYVPWVTIGENQHHLHCPHGCDLMRPLCKEYALKVSRSAQQISTRLI
jgi:hypothetical protein